MMTRMFLAWVAAVFCALTSHAAIAMTVEVHGNQVFATGPVEDDLRKFEEAFAKPGVETVVFVNSPGGDGWTALRVGRLIAEKRYTTVIAGSCISACSIMFMGGKHRRFSDALRPAQTMIGIHGGHNKETKQVDPRMQPQIYAFYKQHMGEKFNSEVMNQALYDMDDAGSLLRVFDPVRSSKTAPYHCKSSQTPRNQCTKLDGKDAVNLGIVTQPELVKVDLPTAFKPANTVFGRELVNEIADVPTALNELAQSKCPAQACKDNVLKFTERNEHRSIASALSVTGIGVANNADTPAQAVNRAVYNCNHPANTPARLCEAKFVNGFDVSALYAQSDAAHAKALVELQAPPEKFYGNEEFGGNFTKADGLRREKLIDITPQSLDGIKTIGTQELARSLKQEGFVLFDVMGFFDTIPGSKTLLNAGHVRDVAKDDELLEKRIEGLLTAMQPDKSKPVAFFCTGRSCWLSVNAAMRAKKLGYTQVMWYRGGLESWKAAGLAVVPNAIRAIAN
jgi:rhodanese-related sulfurtransferase/ATP-dependent protease ClpP protease subunit